MLNCECLTGAFSLRVGPRPGAQAVSRGVIPTHRAWLGYGRSLRGARLERLSRLDSSLALLGVTPHQITHHLECSTPVASSHRVASRDGLRRAARGVERGAGGGGGGGGSRGAPMALRRTKAQSPTGSASEQTYCSRGASGGPSQSPWPRDEWKGTRLHNGAAKRGATRALRYAAHSTMLSFAAPKSVIRGLRCLCC